MLTVSVFFSGIFFLISTGKFQPVFRFWCHEKNICSLSLTHTHTHTHTHAHTHTLSLSHTHTLTLSHTHTLTLSHKHTLSPSLSLSLHTFYHLTHSPANYPSFLPQITFLAFFFLYLSLSVSLFFFLSLPSISFYLSPFILTPSLFLPFSLYRSHNHSFIVLFFPLSLSLSLCLSLPLSFSV